MKLFARIAAALAALALAVPVLACDGSKEMKTTDKPAAKPAVAAAQKGAAPAAKPQAEKAAPKPAASQN